MVLSFTITKRACLRISRTRTGGLFKWRASSIRGDRSEVESLSDDNQTAAGGRHAVVNFNLIFLQLVSTGRDSTIPFLFRFSHQKPGEIFVE